MVTGLIVGLGSVGKSHAKALDTVCETIYVIDPNDKVNEWAKLNLKARIIYFDTLEKLNNGALDSVTTLAIVSNWGPQHYETVKKLIRLGVKKIICEKPFTDNLWKAKKLTRLAKKCETKILVGITRRHTDYAKNLKILFQKYCGDKILFISAQGGAQCLVTTGIHYLDLACQLFEDHPSHVFATISNSEINPRSRELGFFDGVASWSFSENRSLNFAFSNESNLRVKLYIYGERGYLEIDAAENINVYAIQNNNVSNSLKLTNTKSSQLIISIPDSQLRHPDPFVNQINLMLSGEESKYSLTEAQTVLNSLVGALVASKKEKLIYLPIKETSLEFYKDWNFS
jgi:predicted dehydrogenase